MQYTSLTASAALAEGDDIINGKLHCLYAKDSSVCTGDG